MNKNHVEWLNLHIFDYWSTFISHETFTKHLKYHIINSLIYICLYVGTLYNCDIHFIPTNYTNYQIYLAECLMLLCWTAIYR